MATITSTRQLLVYQGDSVNLADFLMNLPVLSIWRLMPGGNWVEYEVSRPQFAVFSTLERGNICYLVSSTTGYDFPGAGTETTLGTIPAPAAYDPPANVAPADFFQTGFTPAAGATAADYEQYFMPAT